MKQQYNPPELEIVIFSPVERLSDDAETVDIDLKKLTDLSRAAGDPTLSMEGDIFLPLW